MTLSLNVGEFIHAAQGLLVIGDPKSVIEIKHSNTVEANIHPHNVSTDSRTIHTGDIFFAIKGDQFDGHQFINESIRKGASLCIISQIPSNLTLPPKNPPSIIKVRDTRKALADFAGLYRKKYGEKLKVVGISGSCGKTTIKEMIAQILSLQSPTVYSRGNFNNEIGCPMSILSLTPEHQFGVFEIGASALGEVGRLSETVKPDVAVISNIKLEHTETFGDLKNIAEGESEILPALNENGWAVLPSDDPFYQFLQSRIPDRRQIRVKSFGFSKDASVSAENISVRSGSSSKRKTEKGLYPELVTTFKLVHRSEGGKILSAVDCALPVLGKFNIVNACAAAAACFSLDVPPELVQQGLEHFNPLQMRFQIHHLKNNVTLINDSYNANPGSMRASLEGFVESFPNKERCAVLGDMLELGEISKNEHYTLGNFLATLPLSKIILHGPQAKFIYEGAKDSLIDEKSIRYCAGKDELWKAVQSILSSETVLLFKASRGVHLEEIIQKIIESENA